MSRNVLARWPPDASYSATWSRTHVMGARFVLTFDRHAPSVRVRGRLAHRARHALIDTGPTSQGVRCMLMRGGTSKGAYFLADDLPADSAERDELLLRIMGTPDARQIDGIGGAHPLTSKVAVVGPSSRPDADVDYLFLQVVVDEPIVTDRQNCGNLLAGVGPFADRARPGRRRRRRRRRRRCGSSWSTPTASPPPRSRSSDGLPVYAGDTAIAGVPGTAAAIRLDFADIAGGVVRRAAADRQRRRRDRRRRGAR